MLESTIRGQVGIIVEDICLNANVNLIGWALYDTEGLPIYSKFKSYEGEFGALAAIIINVYKRIPELGGSCYYLPKMDILLHRLKIDSEYFILIIAIEKNIRNHGLVVIQIKKLENRMVQVLNKK